MDRRVPRKPNRCLAAAIREPGMLMACSGGDFDGGWQLKKTCEGVPPPPPQLDGAQATPSSFQLMQRGVAVMVRPFSARPPDQHPATATEGYSSKPQQIRHFVFPMSSQPARIAKLGSNTEQ